jgi:enterochelin esterase-like enzyme
MVVFEIIRDLTKMKKYFFLILFYTITFSSLFSQNFSELEIIKVTDINLSSGELMRIENFPSQFVQPRHVDVWLPNNYSSKKKYAVLYMHDGQMLFDSTKTWNKQEWKVDEIASNLILKKKTKDFIVVAIWNISALRNSNYFPEKVYNKIPQKDKDSLQQVGKRHNWINTINSDNYLKFIVEELKPFIDLNFSTFTDVKNTCVLGSSRGGLISMYAICEYPKIFGAAACLSTHWIGTYSNIQNDIPYVFMEYLKLNLPDANTHRIYFDYGDQTLDALYLPYQNKITSILKEKKYDKNELFEGADHSENSWNQRLDIPFLFLFGNSN